jgi:ABC-type Fe3+ transport system permease subunit
VFWDCYDPKSNFDCFLFDSVILIFFCSIPEFTSTFLLLETRFQTLAASLLRLVDSIDWVQATGQRYSVLNFLSGQLRFCCLQPCYQSHYRLVLSPDALS